MAVVDYEAAWVRLGQVVAAKSQHGRDGLLRDMAEIAADCRVPAGELSRLLRLYGVEVERARLIEAESDRPGQAVFVGGEFSPGDRVPAGHHRPGGHDGRSNGNGSSGGLAGAH